MKLYQFILAGLVGAGLLVAAVYWIARGKTARVEGSITEVRTLGMDRNSSVAIVDFEFTNYSDALVMIGDRDLIVVDQDGIVHESYTLKTSDLRQLFRYFPALGQIKHEPVVDRTKIPSGESLRGMVAARFEIPKHELDLRREIIFRITDVDGAVSELSLESDQSSSAE